MTMMWVTAIIFVLLVLFVAAMYNGLIDKRNRADEALSGIDVMLKKRFDLIPNLVATVKQYMDHERETLEELTSLRSRALTGDPGVAERAEIDRRMEDALGRLFVSIEAYPDLKASENFLRLQASLFEIEEQLSAARRAYNAAVTELNNAVEMVPTNIVAAWMGMERRPFFEAEERARGPLDVGALFNP